MSSSDAAAAPGAAPATKLGTAVLQRLRPMLGVAVLVAIWWVAAGFQLIDPVLLPTPAQTFATLVDALVHGTLALDLCKTIYRTVVSFAIGCGIAIPLGVMLGSSENVYRAVEFPIEFFRATPASSLFPLFLILFGVGDHTKIAVGAFGAAIVILFNVAYGVINARKTRVLAAHVMGAGFWRTLTDVYLWESLPQTLVGMRNGVSIALVVIIVAEMFVGSTDGLGNRLYQAQMMLDAPMMYASIFLTGALGYGLNWIFVLVERNFVHWSGK
jgi:NitT/TauT family transport system permease protein